MEYSKCMDDMLSFNHVYNTLKTRGPFAIRRVKQFQFIFHEGRDLGVAWHEDLNFDIMIWQLPATIDSIRPLQVGTTEDHHRWQLVAILRIQAVDTKKKKKSKSHYHMHVILDVYALLLLDHADPKFNISEKCPLSNLLLLKSILLISKFL